MKAKTLQIVWHGKEPVFTLDFHPTNPALLATGGADKDIKARLAPVCIQGPPENPGRFKPCSELSLLQTPFFLLLTAICLSPLGLAAMHNMWT
eukprot:1161640-Pelagomonas_calceolata.AAC.13